MSGTRRNVLVAVAVFLVTVLYLQRRISASDTINQPNNLSLRPIDQVVFEVVSDGNTSCPVKLRGELRPGRSKGRPIQFIHMPKAGGTSVQESLNKWAIAQGIPVTLHDGDGPLWNSNSGKGLFLGHRGFGFSQRVQDRKPFTIIALREPVSRIISLFDYLKRTDEDIPTVAMIRRAWQKKTLDEVVESYRVTRESNPYSLLPGGSASFSDRTLHRVLHGQVQFLCGYECVWYMTGDPRESIKPFEGLTKEQILERARANLEQIDCVAVLNRLDDLLYQLKIYFDFVPPNFNAFPHENTVNPNEKSQPSEETLNSLREWTKDESELFERAKVIAMQKTARAAQCLNPP